jgi:hypothetical protein
LTEREEERVLLCIYFEEFDRQEFGFGIQHIMSDTSHKMHCRIIQWTSLFLAFAILLCGASACVVVCGTGSIMA